MIRSVCPVATPIERRTVPRTSVPSPQSIKIQAQQLLVATSTEGEVIGTMQLTVIPGLARVGSSRLQIEAVRVRADHRSRGIGGAMIRWAVDNARTYGAQLVQLPSDAARVDAHRFY